MPMKSRLALTVVTATCLTLLVGCSAAQPLHRSAASIRSSLLTRTPVGASSVRVLEFIRKEGWQPYPHPGPPDRSVLHQTGASGDVATNDVRQTVSVFLGDYWAWPVFGRRVMGEWLFDANDQLLDVWVWKYTQGL
jgi:hypothetical protein